MADSTNHIFPFKSTLNIRLLLEFWEERIRQGHFPAFVQSIQEYINQAPELRAEVLEPSVFEKHKPFIDFLMSAAVPSATSSNEIVAAMSPFNFKTSALYSSPAFLQTINLHEFEDARANLPGGNIHVGKIIRACLLILQKYQHVKALGERPVTVTIRNQVTDLDHVYKIEINSQFCDIITTEEYKPVDKSVLKFLMEKLYDTDLWLQYFKPENFEFRGFVIMRLVDVTEHEMISAIKYDLLERNAVMRKESFIQIQHKLRSLFGISDIRLGIAYLDPNNDLIINNPNANCWNSVTANRTNQQCQDFSSSVYERSWMEKRYITVENLLEYPFKSPVEDSLIANGVRNLLLAPLLDDDGEVIGMLELASPSTGKLNPISAHKVENILPMFTAAVKRVKEEMFTEVRALIQEECTAIHPTVQWRFFEAGVNLLNKRRRNEKAAFEEIAFKDVYPLYGMADVRNSSIERNAAIQKDLQQNLKLAKELLHKIHDAKKLPLLEEVIFKVDEQLQKINRGLASGDESNVLDFLKSEITPLIQHFEHEPELDKIIARYKTHLDPVFGVVYRRRKGFEESLGLINKTISTYLDEAEEEAQKMFPHYFEKYKTDGVEFTMYLGSSLVKDKAFDIFTLHNFRLWQLLVMIEINRKVDALKSHMKSPLDITQLILVHDQPISIRFRPDEKQFDVDGAYDIRYEIVKKRIDKAHIKNTGERLTQPGKIAIVYNQAKIEDEYRRYFHYLRAKKLITGEVEELELEELPGANGLRALRIQAAEETSFVATAQSGEDLLRDIEEGLQIH